MSIQHQNLAQGQWQKFGLAEQLANIGSEVSRALNWQKKNNPAFMEKAVIRALELLDLTVETTAGFYRRRELLRLREALVDYFYGDNTFGSSEKSWRNYFDHFNYLVRKNY